MTPRARRGLIVAALHVAIVASLGAKLVVDRATRPRVWARTAPFDPNLPIRGRYVRMRVEAIADPDLPFTAPSERLPVRLEERNGQLVARQPTDGEPLRALTSERDGTRVAIVDQPLAYFIPEHVKDPSIREPGEELWVELTLTRRGPPRPIRLGVKKDGVLSPLEFE